MRGCLLLDIRMPGGPSGLELHQALKRQGESLPVIFLTGHGDIPMSVKAMKNGAIDFLTKPIDRDTLLKAVGSALKRERDNHEAVSRQREILDRAKSLTPSEGEVFCRVVAGHPNKQIAADLGCSERTVKAHVTSIFNKLGANSRTEAVAIAMRNDLLPT